MGKKVKPKQKSSKKVKYIIEVPKSFIDYCYRNAKTKEQKTKIEQIIKNQI